MRAGFFKQSGGCHGYTKHIDTGGALGLVKKLFYGLPALEARTYFYIEKKRYFILSSPAFNLSSKSLGNNSLGWGLPASVVLIWTGILIILRWTGGSV